MKALMGFALAALIAFPAAAMADARTGKGHGRDRGDACADAKTMAGMGCLKVRSYGACECGRDETFAGTASEWTCSAEAYCDDGRSNMPDGGKPIWQVSMPDK